MSNFISSFPLTMLNGMILATKAVKRLHNETEDDSQEYSILRNISDINDMLNTGDMKELLAENMVSVIPLGEANTNLWNRLELQSKKTISKLESLLKRSKPAPRLIDQRSSNLMDRDIFKKPGGGTIRFSLNMRRDLWIIVPEGGANILVRYDEPLVRLEQGCQRCIYVDGEIKNKYIDLTDDVIKIVDKIESMLMDQFNGHNTKDTLEKVIKEAGGGGN